ncbi:MAG: c-type cytochrome [Bacteroidia bacterium]
MNKKVKQVISLMAVIGCIVISTTSCEKKDPNSPGYEYMPDMYRSPSLETNMGYVLLKNGDTMMVNRMPVKGTIARGFMPYPYPNTQEGYEAAGLNWHNPLPVNDANEKQGEELYLKFCVHCHGKGGEADGPVASKLSGPPPSYKSPALMALPEGKMFHSITYGKGLMGAHAPLLSKEEIWKVIEHIHKMQYPNGMPTAAADSAAAKKPEVKQPK